MRDRTARYRFLSMHYATSTERDGPHEHRKLMDAALAKDIDKTCELLASHYQTTTDSVHAHELRSTGETVWPEALVEMLVEVGLFQSVAYKAG